MVGRFACEELAKEAQAHEDLYAKPGVLGRCSCLLGAFLMVMGLLTFLNLESVVFGVVLGAPLSPAPVESGDSGMGWREPVPMMGIAYGGLGASMDFGATSLPDPDERPEVPSLTLDFSLIALCITGLSLCLLPPCARLLSGPWGSSWFGPGPVVGADPLLGPLGAGAALRGRVVDVKPGELRGLQAGNLWGTSGWQQGAGSVDWAGTATASAAPQWGSPSAWSSPVPSAYSTPAKGSPGVPASTGLWSTLGGALGSSAQLGGVLPTEADVADTYAAFGVELQQWTPSLAAVLDREVIGPLVQMIDASDQMWHQALAPRGWRLSFEAPRLAYPGVGPPAQELSVFDRNLPRPICDDPRAVDLWKSRQVFEAYLMHPMFEPGQRAYVLERLREWRQRGLQNSVRADYRPSDQLPTDAHILENLVFKMLSLHLDFGSCFVTVGPSPPVAKHQGQAPTAYLRQVTDQAVLPRPAPHYEVVTLHKTWRLRPGNSNLLEALALLMQALRRHSQHSYQAFPQSLRTALESTAATSAPARTFSWF